MQRIANGVLMVNNQVLLLQKPRRNWWVAPGGKMELGETVTETCIREYKEETNVKLIEPQVKGIFTFIIKEKDKIISEWMMFTFLATDYEGTNLEESTEGKIAWHNQEDVLKLPMAPGDYYILDHVMNGEGVKVGTFTYNQEMELLDYRFS